jgi:multiple sugar transport system ATP-binding protein
VKPLAGVAVSKVVKTFGKVNVIHGIDLEVKDGEFVVLVGPSGCGKSTLLRMIAGLESVSGGNISIGGRIVNDLPPRERDVAMVFQDYALYPHKTVYENMAFGLRMRDTPAAEIITRVQEAAEMLQISHLFDRRPGQLSGGQRQRVAMGRSIVRRPQVFLFDEPLSNLDAQLRGEVRIEIKKLHQRFGTTIVYVTHDQVEAMTLADRIAVLRGGHLEQFASPDEIYNRPASRFVAGFMGSPPMSFVEASLNNHGARLELAGGFGIDIPPGQRPPVIGNGRKVVAGLRPEHVTPAHASDSADTVVQARIELLEPLGAETLALLSLGPTHITGRFPPDAKWRVGQQVPLALQRDKIHLFDPESGIALTGN